MAKIPESAFIDPSAVVRGDVTLGEFVNVWFHAAVRGIGMKITVGNGTNIQDCVVIHGDIGNEVVIGNYVSLGHGSVIHGCTIEDNCVIGMNAVVLDHAHIGAGSIVGAGAVVPAGAIIPPGSLVVGMPAKVKRALTPEEVESNIQNAKDYMAFAAAEKAAQEN
jgi:carbonic anhydrase/acetyltransferase-like protein (isoleucine patch superfamily)